MSEQQPERSPQSSLLGFLEKNKAQLDMALPQHINADRMIRLAMTAFSSNKDLMECDPKSILASVIVASQLGLEIGVTGQGFLVPYKKKATFVPGWQGLVDLVSRAGRAAVWTGSVFEGDTFDFSLGDSPFVKHKPSGEDDNTKLTHVYAIGRTKGGDWPVVEVWPIERIKRHRDKYNKVGDKHYSHKYWEMYARKVPLLQVLKYMPKSIELSAAIGLEYSALEGKPATIDANFTVIPNEDDNGGDNGDPKGPPAYQQDQFEKNLSSWQAAIASGKKSAEDIIKMVSTKGTLTEEQKNQIRAGYKNAEQSEQFAGLTTAEYDAWEKEGANK